MGWSVAAANRREAERLVFRVLATGCIAMGVPASHLESVAGWDQEAVGW